MSFERAQQLDATGRRALRRLDGSPDSGRDVVFDLISVEFALSSELLPEIRPPALFKAAKFRTALKGGGRLGSEDESCRTAGKFLPFRLKTVITAQMFWLVAEDAEESQKSLLSVLTRTITV